MARSSSTAWSPSRPPRCSPRVTSVDYAEYFPLITAQAHALAAAARESELTAQGPSCPEWDVAKLVRHTGTAHRWSSGVVQTREPLSPKSIDLEIPDDPGGLP